ncbi:App1 family protein [Quadrisphaera sp. DSM 44207]|uniref:App1 family protein n=1 Tax=Quadrisphaera sp. DSM 44207 TaxID=1881057 RepID=UPI00350F5E98
MAETLADTIEQRLHRAARIEDRVHRVLAARLRRRGWTPRVVAYAGYGGPGWVRVMARVLLTRPGHPEDAQPGGAPASPPAAGGRRPSAWPSRLGRPGGTPDQLRQVAAEAVEALRGWRSFVSAPLDGVRVRVDVAGRTHELTSDRGGYVDAVLEADLPPGVHALALGLPGGGAGGSAPVVVVGPDVEHGVVSDIDDTVMVTSLPRPLIAAWNTFVLHEHARRPVPGMAALLTDAARRSPGAPVLYLSTGAWNVAPTLTRFMARHGFPAGPLLLTDWGPTNTGWFRSGREHKRAALRRLAEELPRVRWLLVGDDGQHDPEIYHEFADAHPDRVSAIAIRQLTPTEQVLSRGSTAPSPSGPGPGAPARPGAVPEFRAPDGEGLAERLRAAGLM